jgi:hypothetical protein
MLISSGMIYRALHMPFLHYDLSVELLILDVSVMAGQFNHLKPISMVIRTDML